MDLRFNSETQELLGKPRTTDDSFSSRWAFAFSSLGSMVGTGNIWRFSRIAAINSNGGALPFLFVWFCFLWIWAVPILLLEYALGHWTRKGIVESASHLGGHRFRWLGAWIVFVSTLICSYYIVIIGWCVYYLFLSLIFDLPADKAASDKNWQDMNDSAIPTLLHLLMVSLSGACVYRGVRAFEKVNLFLVPTMLFIVAFSFFWALSLENAGVGVKFLFSGSWSALGNPRLWTDALAQIAFDTGAGCGIYATYSIYMKSQYGIVKSATITPACNNVISLVCCITTFATVFSILQSQYSQDEILEIMRDSGPAGTGLAFLWMPLLFQTMRGGSVVSVLFFLALSFAGFTTLIALLEVLVVPLTDAGLSRPQAVLGATFFTAVVGIGSAVNLEFLVNQDFVWGTGLLVNGLIWAFLLNVYGVKKFRETHINGGFSSPVFTAPRLPSVSPSSPSSPTFGATEMPPLELGATGVSTSSLPHSASNQNVAEAEESETITARSPPVPDYKDWRVPPIWEYIIRFVVPILGLVLLVWFFVDSLLGKQGSSWYNPIQETSLMSLLLQWGFAAFILWLVNHLLTPKHLRNHPLQTHPPNHSSSSHELPQHHRLSTSESIEFKSQTENGTGFVGDGLLVESSPRKIPHQNSGISGSSERGGGGGSDRELSRELSETSKLLHTRASDDTP